MSLHLFLNFVPSYLSVWNVHIYRRLDLYIHIYKDMMLQTFAKFQTGSVDYTNSVNIIPDPWILDFVMHCIT